MAAYFTAEACVSLAFDRDSKRDPDNDGWLCAHLGWLPEDKPTVMAQAMGVFPKAFQLIVRKHDSPPEHPFDRFKPLCLTVP